MRGAVACYSYQHAPRKRSSGLARVAMRHHYFDDLHVGDSTGRFLAEVTQLVVLRDQLVARGTDAAITA